MYDERPGTPRKLSAKEEALLVFELPVNLKRIGSSRTLPAVCLCAAIGTSPDIEGAQSRAAGY